METEKKPFTNRTEILKTLEKILVPWLDDKTKPNEQTNLLSDLGLDSVAILQLVLGIEKEFSVTIKDSELDSDVFSKLANLIDVIEGKLK
ncbi:MAG TPA: acyl carrier protein [Sedimentisphaerales bacterium]|nr:acyl carrier protein [Sedimentisphaerales bacterium]